MADLLADFAAAVARHPDRIAIIDGTGHETSFAALKARADRLAAAWHKQGIRRGDRVLLAMAVTADLYASLAALWSLGATVVLPEPAMGLAGLRHAARTAEVSAYCSAGGYGVLKYALPELWSLRHLRVGHAGSAAVETTPPQATDIALISFTSGTTGAPKAIPRSHAFLAAQHRAVAPLLHSNISARDLVAFPVFVLINIASGRTSVLPNWKMSRLDRLPPEALADWMATQGVTRALLPPALCEKLAQTTPPDSLDTVFTGGGPVFPDILDSLRAAKPGVEIICVYGSTEAEPIAHLEAHAISQTDLDDMLGGKGLLVGPPVGEIDVRIMADEIQVAGAHVNGGYLNPAHDIENKVRADGKIWHRTGDAGHFDTQGRLWLLGRTGTAVPTERGETYPFCIEVAARQWPGVQNCALVAVAQTVCLAITGEQEHLPDWQSKAAALGISSVRHLPAIPMDKRHGSKTDRAALKTLLQR